MVAVLFLEKVDEPQQVEPVMEVHAKRSVAYAGSHWDEDIDFTPQVPGGTYVYIMEAPLYLVHCY